MRTTPTLDDDAGAIVHNCMRARSPKLGKAVSESIRRAWERNEQHETMGTRVERHARAGRGTRAPTQAGFVRVLSQPVPGPGEGRVGALADAREHNLPHPSHRFVLLDFDFAAVRSGMKLLTFHSGLKPLLVSPAEGLAYVEVLAGPD